MALATAFVVAGAGPLAAQGSSKKPTLVGSWLETVTFPPEFGRPPLKSLSSYHSDETMSCTDQGNVTVGPAERLQRVSWRLEAAGQAHLRVHRASS